MTGNTKHRSKNSSDGRKNMDNTKVWDAVSKTDPHFAKKFSRGGGFSGTAINATYNARKATELFGPMGIGWGVEILEEDMMQGAPIVIDGQVVCHEIIHKVRAKLWYEIDGKRGEIVQFGQTTFVGKNKYGPFTDEEAPKKSLTDATTKCLALLGFSADIFTGLYDDNKYVEGLRKEFAPKVEPDKETLAALEKAAKEGYEAFQRAWKSADAEKRKTIGKDELARLKELTEAAEKQEAA